MASPIPPFFLLPRALLALLHFAALGSSGGVARVASKTLELVPTGSHPAWLHLATGQRRKRTIPWGSGRSRSWCSCVMRSPVDGGDDGDGGGAPSQGTAGGRSPDGGIGSFGGSSSSSGGGGGGGSSNNNNNRNDSGSSANGSAEGAGGAGEARGALERQFSKPAAPRTEVISEGMGRGVPSPRQRLRLQQENLDMRWNMSKLQDQTICCRQCAGEGVEECRFCAGTGMFKIGSELIVDPVSGRPPPCPVCKGKGEERCSRCNGAGRIATWLFKSERNK